MQYVCDALKGRTWFRIESDAEAIAETSLMRHAVEKHFRREQERARQSYRPGPGLERDIGLKAHLIRTTPLFLTLRADDGEGLATAMLPAGGRKDEDFHIIVVGPENCSLATTASASPATAATPTRKGHSAAQTLPHSQARLSHMPTDLTPLIPKKVGTSGDRPVLHM